MYQQRLFFFTVMFFCAVNLHAQELFVYTEPASNMAAGSIGFRLNNSLMLQEKKGRVDHYFNPEIMFGISKKWMLHGEGYFSNSTGRYKANGAGVYAKYRFFSTDEVHSHFRMAAYGRYSFVNNLPARVPVNLTARNSSFETGLVATALKNKTAVSAGVSIIHATGNGSKNKWLSAAETRDAFGYTISLGQLVLPKEYVSYDQLNMNLMLEILGQTALGNGKNFTDLAPSVQFIIKSRMRVDLGYRIQVINSYQRQYPQSFLLRFEYNIFNAF